MSERVVRAICGAPERPLLLGDVEIPCYVLEDERRVLVQAGMMQALGISSGSAGKRGGDRLTKFTHQKRISPYIDNDILDRIVEPIKFRVQSGSLAYGYDAEVLAKICFAVVDANKEERLQKQQKHIAKQCEILIRGFAVVGINALVDEATGYQEIREHNALAKILERYIADEYSKWTKTFPDEFYREMFRLKGWIIDPMSVARPSIIGKYTNDLVYERLAPGILAELQKKNPSVKPGRRKQRHHQWLTGNIGHPKLKEHLNGVIALMKAAPNWDVFKRLINRAFPALNKNIELPLDDIE